YRVLLVLEGEQLLEGEHDLVVDGPPLVDDPVLGQVANRRVRGHPDLARVRLFEPREHSQERRLARPIGAGEADPVALLDVPGHVLQEDAVPVALVQVLGVDHASTFRKSRQVLWSMARCSGSMKLSRYSLITLTSMPSHSVQQLAQMEASTFSFTAGGKGTRWAGGGSPGCPQRVQVIPSFLEIFIIRCRTAGLRPRHDDRDNGRSWISPPRTAASPFSSSPPRPSLAWRPWVTRPRLTSSSRRSPK